MTDPIARMERFIVAHGNCGGEVTIPDPSEKDIDGANVWVTARCSGCGNTIREEVPISDMLTGLESLLAMATHDDPEALDPISGRMKVTPRVLLEILRRIRRAQAQESEN